MCAVAPGRGLNDVADLRDGLSYHLFGQTIRPMPGQVPAAAPIASAPMASAVATAPAATLKRRTPMDAAGQDAGLLAPALTAGAPGTKQLTGQ